MDDEQIDLIQPGELIQQAETGELMDQGESEELIQQGESGELIHQGESGELIQQGESGELIHQGESGELIQQGESGELIQQGESGEVIQHGESGELIQQGESGELIKQTETGELIQQEESGELIHQGESGELIQQTETEELIHQGESGELIHPGESGDLLQQGETGDLIQPGEPITISLEDAAQLILQQQGISGDGEVHLPPGTYQIHTQPAGGLGLGADGGILNQGISVAHMTEQGLIVFDPQSSGILFQTGSQGNQDDVDNKLVNQSDEGKITPEQEGETIQDSDQVCLDDGESALLNAGSEEALEADNKDFGGQSESVLQIDLPVGQSDSALQLMNGVKKEGEIMTAVDLADIQADSSNSIPGVPQASLDSPGQDVLDTYGEDEEPDKIPTDSDEILNKADDDVGDTANIEDPSLQYIIQARDTEAPEVSASDQSKPGDEASTLAAVRQPDLSKPIAVTDHMEVTVNGKKCLLKMNDETGQLCAYPLLPQEGKRKRGRPRKQASLPKPSDTENSQEASSVASSESNMGDNSVGTPAQHSDQINSAAECLLELSNTGPDGIRRSGRVRKKARTLNDYEVLEVSSDDEQGQDDEETTGPGMKRKKSHQRDYVPATPVGVGGVKRGRGRPRRYPPPGQVSAPAQIPAMLIPSSTGQTLMMAPIQGLTNLQAFQEQVRAMPTLLPKPDSSGEQKPDAASQYLNTPPALSTAMSIAPEDMVHSILDSNTSYELTQASEAIESRDLSGLAADTTPSETDSTALSEQKISVTSSGENQPTIIQIPENLLPMFMQKKDPIKLGLKATEGQLEKLKCPKCDFQAFYEQQYQKHIQSHTEDVHKCKCCSFVSFTKEELLFHFKDNHPKCFCDVCNFMAEHAYVVKRHMMRHNADGCRCDICGKVYKDQYVLKMHIKMVHMPAEVLFECTLCSKKFTRKAHLKRHVRIHEPEKPFKCPHCTYRGCERSDISKHLLIHEEPKHECEVCGKAFRHIKNKELHVKRHNGQRDYKCGVCDFYGYTFTDIRKHIERKHTETKCFMCDKCRLPFKTELQLRDHQQRECEVVMIEQALAIATSDGGTSQATIQIPSSLSMDGQRIRIHGQDFSLGNSSQVITVEQVNMPEDDCITLTEEQLRQAQIDGHVIDTTQVELIGQMPEDEVPDDVQQVELDEVNLSSEGDITGSGSEVTDEGIRPLHTVVV